MSKVYSYETFRIRFACGCEFENTPPKMGHELKGNAFRLSWRTTVRRIADCGKPHVFEEVGEVAAKT